MSQWLYLLALLFSIGGLALLDHRFKLAFWRDARRTAKTLGVGILLFLIWDALGIGLGIFIHGNGSYSLPFRLAPEFPLEEIFFLLLLCYSALLLYLGGRKIWPHI